MHSVLAHHGGAVRIARLVGAYAAANSWCVRYSSELDDNADGVTIVAPQDVHTVHPDLAGQNGCSETSDDSFPSEEASSCAGGILHLHGSQSWEHALSGILDSGKKPVITMHDVSLLTGGCPHPLHCDGWKEGCYTPCPRHFTDAALVRAERIALLEALQPYIVTPSGWMRDMVKQVLPDCSCTVIPNGVEVPPDTINRKTARALLGISQSAKLVLFMAHGGESAAYKAGDCWQAVWSGISARVPESVCFMVGGDTQAKEGNVIRWPYVDRGAVQMFMAAADLLVYPTLADNHPLVLLEALSMGLPAVAFAEGGVPEIISNGKTGVLVSSRDWDGLVKQSVKLLQAEGKRREMSYACKDAFHDKFTVERMGKAYLALYNRVRC